MSVPIYSLNFRRITPGIETLRSSFSLPRHRHLRAYATVVLVGSFEESGYVGRIRATAGDVLIHPALDCHANQMVSAGVTLIRLAWSDTSGVGGLYRLNEVDALARTAEKDLGEAALLLEHALRKRWPTPPGRRNDWPDLLAAALAQNASIAIGGWAEANGLARETVSRGFAAAYGIAPAVFRAELRARGVASRDARVRTSMHHRGGNGICGPGPHDQMDSPHYGGPACRLAPGIVLRKTDQRQFLFRFCSGRSGLGAKV